MVQTSLNRISQNYPAIPKIKPVTGIFGEDTEYSVRQFQRIFNLASDGVVGKATWYKLVYLYVASPGSLSWSAKGRPSIRSSSSTLRPPRGGHRHRGSGPPVHAGRTG